MLSRRMTDAKVTGFCALLSVAIFAVDVIAPLGVAGGVPYVAPILIASWASRRRSILIFAAAGAALTVLGYFLSEPGGPHWMVLTNRAIALFAIWITAVLAYTRKRTEEALGGSETRSRAIFDQAAVGMGLMTPGGRFLAVNKRLCELMGRQAPELLKMRFNEFTHPDDYEDCVKQIVRLVAGEISTFTTEMRYVPVTGVTLWGNLTVSLVRAPSSDRISLLGVVEDITERVRAEEEARIAKARLDEAIESLPEGFMLFDAEERLVICNSAYSEKIYPELADRMVPGRTFEAWARDIAYSGQVVESVGREEAWLAERLGEFRNPTGPKDYEHSGDRWLQICDTKTPSGYTAGLRMDITERKRAEKALKESEGKFRDLVEGSIQGLLVVSSAWKPLFANEAEARIMGYDGPEEILALDSVAALIAPEERAGMRAYTCAHLNGKAAPNQLMYRGLRKDGSEVWLEISARAVVWEGEPALQATTVDVSERVRAEAELRHAQKLEAVGQLTAGVAHEFNNLLHANLGFLELLERELEDNTDLRQLVEGASGAAWRAAEITGKLLAFGRNQMLRPRTIDFNTIVPGMTSILRSTMGAVVEIETVLPGNLWQAKADPAQVESALVNLALNARDAMPQGGKLTIETANAHIDRDLAANFSEARTGDYVKLAVSDNGSGMPPEVMEHAFEPFFTTKDVGKGTGLGLSMVYGFAQQSKGFVVIDSEVGRGTRVELYVPKAPDTSEERGAAP